MHRDFNAAWNLWEVAVASTGDYRGQHTSPGKGSKRTS